MIHIHPFPARMAPDIALNVLSTLPKNYLVLDPMSGSGMVLGEASNLGLSAIGYDIDPLARLISRVNGAAVKEDKVREASDELLRRCMNADLRHINLSWIDEDVETLRFIDFWFDKKQIAQLRKLSYFLVEKPFIKNEKILNTLKISVSRLIVTKEPKASRARDTAHSRPHRTILKNDFDIFSAIPKSLEHVFSALRGRDMQADVKVYRGDAKKMGRVRDASVDCIVTSPPYLNAIDYLRGHRMSLVWFGYNISRLKKFRRRYVGAEIVDKRSMEPELKKFLSSLNFDIDSRRTQILQRYYKDLCEITKEAFRVLRPGRQATYIVGNSNIKGNQIKNSELLKISAKKNGFKFVKNRIREIPENQRYMPLINSRGTSLAKRMRTEHILTFEKILE